jgi:hypothetical protein
MSMLVGGSVFEMKMKSALSAVSDRRFLMT